MNRKEIKSSDAQRNRKRNDKLNKSINESNNKLPGDYPPQEDIMNRRDTERLSIDEQNFSRQSGQENKNQPGERLISNPGDVQEEPLLDGNRGELEEPAAAHEMERPVPLHLLDEDDLFDSEPNESDVTKEDLQALGPKDLSLDMGDDEQLLKNRVWPVDMAGDDLDVPGAELDDADESAGSEDEENNSYSIGGDRNEDKLEGKDE